ncbi:hypothetical protein ACFX2I_041437 [Malus domestica]
MSNPQLADFSSSNPRRPRICSESYIHSWENPFPVPQPGQESVMVEKTTNFKDTDVITKLVVWAHLPRVPVQYKKKNIIKDITQPIGRVIRVDEDEPPVYPEDVVVDDDVKASLQKNVMLYFPNATIVDEDYNEVEEFGQRVEDMGLDEDGWTTDVMMSNVGRVESEARENLRSFVAAMLAAEAASVSARPTVGMMSPRKRVCEVDIDEAGPSTYLEELD